MTPVIRDANEALSLKEISVTVKDLAKRARDKKLKPEEYQGGTITVSNLRSHGVEQFFASHRSSPGGNPCGGRHREKTGRSTPQNEIVVERERPFR